MSDKTEDCLTNLRFADDVLHFSTSLEKLSEMLCEFNASTEAVGLGIHPGKTKILSNQDKVKVNEISVDNIKTEVLKEGDSARYLGQKITFEEQETEEIKKQTEGSVSSVPQVSPGIDLERLPALPQTSSFQLGHHTYVDLCQWNMDINTETRKDDQDCATKDAPSHRPHKKNIQIKNRCIEQKRGGS